MTVVVITPPSSIVLPQEAYDAGLFSEDDDETLVQTLLDAAQAQVDGPGGWIGRAIGQQVLEYHVDEFPCTGGISLPYRPISSIIHIKYDDGDWEEQTFDADSYRLSGSTLTLAGGASWPTIADQIGAIRIRYDAGYDTVPADIKIGIMLLAAQMKTLGIGPGHVRSESVEGMGSIDYQVPSDATAALKASADRLFFKYMVPEL